MVSEADLARTLTVLVDEKAIDPQHAEELRSRLPEIITNSRYVMSHLGAHIGIGVIFAFDAIPLPLGTIGRVSWVAGSRFVETLRGRWAQARVHSLGVFLVAVVPWIGYGAYLLPLRRQGGDVVFLFANHAWLSQSGRTFEAAIAARPRIVRRACRWLVPAPR